MLMMWIEKGEQKKRERRKRRSRVLDDAEGLLRSELRETLREFRGELLRLKELLAEGINLKGETIRAIGQDVGGVERQRVNVDVDVAVESIREGEFQRVDGSSEGPDHKLLQGHLVL